MITDPEEIDKYLMMMELTIWLKDYI
jgi:hypothetical protein